MNHPAFPKSPAPMGNSKRLPGFRATLIREERFEELQRIQSRSFDPHFDLRDLSDAAIALALEMGDQAILERARAELKRRL